MNPEQGLLSPSNVPFTSDFIKPDMRVEILWDIEDDETQQIEQHWWPATVLLRLAAPPPGALAALPRPLLDSEGPWWHIRYDARGEFPPEEGYACFVERHVVRILSATDEDELDEEAKEDGGEGRGVASLLASPERASKRSRLDDAQPSLPLTSVVPTPASRTPNAAHPPPPSTDDEPPLLVWRVEGEAWAGTEAMHHVDEEEHVDEEDDDEQGEEGPEAALFRLVQSARGGASMPMTEQQALAEKTKIVINSFKTQLGKYIESTNLLHREEHKGEITKEDVDAMLAEMKKNMNS